ncbi:hypothetical protein [Brevundimonas pishanensis]|uniref:hypothetical protein n=1 Tax=Brevundimonas pishanensis TaxID=2896315 RepID=UPI001FA75D67|nr:hypothetical protein [Brevundimonas pishanensis]
MKSDGAKISSRTRLLQAAAALMTERGSIEISLSEIAQKSQLNGAGEILFRQQKRAFA